MARRLFQHRDAPVAVGAICGGPEGEGGTIEGTDRGAIGAPVNSCLAGFFGDVPSASASSDFACASSSMRTGAGLAAGFDFLGCGIATGSFSDTRGPMRPRSEKRREVPKINFDLLPGDGSD